MNALAQKEHDWLQKLVGHWMYEAACSMGSDQPEMKAAGTEAVRTLGGLWVLCEGQGEMPGAGPCSTVMTLGYDPLKKRFVGTFVASMMTYLWLYDGQLDTGEDVLTLHSEGPDMVVEGKLAKYKDVIAFHGDNERTMTSHLVGQDGTWQPFMTARYRRA